MILSFNNRDYYDVTKKNFFAEFNFANLGRFREIKICKTRKNL